MNTAEKYIRMYDGGSSKTGLTRIWVIRNIRSGEDCGKIKWYGGFRKYAFFPSDGFLFDADCLRFIAERLDFVNVKTKKP